MSEIKTTALNQAHKNLGAKMVPFAGYEMPVSYAGIKDEHKCVREEVGVFDVSHMGYFDVAGEKATEYLDYLTVNNVAGLSTGQVQYSAMCYDHGGVVDDILIYKLSDNHYKIVVNASNIEKDFDWAKSKLMNGVELTNQSSDFGILAIQGPKAKNLIQDLFGESPLSLGYYSCTTVNFNGKDLFISRTGYTGEDGFECYPDNDTIESLWIAILEKGRAYNLQPCGLGCRDTLRLESGFSLYGHEITEETNILEAGLSWIVDLEKDDFISKARLLETREQGFQKKIVGIELLEKGIPREGYEIYSGDTNVGVITSGSIMPTTNKAIAMAYVHNAYNKMGTELELDIRGRRKKCKVVSRRKFKEV